MPLIKSISGIRGTIGGKPTKNLTSIDVVKIASSYAQYLHCKNQSKKKPKIIIGRDARISGEMLNFLICGTMISMGVNSINIGLATTPTTAIAVKREKADGGIILTASHNPKQWNALKLLNEDGEMISAEECKAILTQSEKQKCTFSTIDNLGKMLQIKDYHRLHIKQILSLDLVDKEAIKKANFTVAVDVINSVGGLVIPDLLKSLGVDTFIILNGIPNGNFAHNPEPLPENLFQLSATITKEKADVGFAVDPDVDRLAIVNEDGTMFGEEYTVVAIADYILLKKGGATVSNLSSSRALRDITKSYGGKHYSSPVGEVNVVSKMKKVKATIGGEGNGGVIYPENHYVRDALVGIALFLTYLAKKKTKCSELRKSLPNYYITKSKIEIKNASLNKIFSELKKTYKKVKINTTDGLKIDFPKEWIHIRKSNTEPILRIYTESENQEKSELLSKKIIDQIKKIIQ